MHIIWQPHRRYWVVGLVLCQSDDLYHIRIRQIIRDPDDTGTAAHFARFMHSQGIGDGDELHVPKQLCRQCPPTVRMYPKRRRRDPVTRFLYCAYALLAIGFWWLIINGKLP